MENSNNKSNWKFIVGAGLGIAAGLYANSQKGKEHRMVASEYIAKGTELAKEKGAEVVQKSNNIISEIKNKGIDYLANLKSETTESTDEISQFLEKEMAALQRKVNRKIDAAKQEQA